MTGIGMMLKAFGVNFTDEHIKAVEALIPELPAKVASAFKTVDSTLENFDCRLKTIESTLEAITQNQREIIQNQCSLLTTAITDTPKKVNHGKRTNGPDSTH